jgi:hypothetical protein
MTFDLRAAPSQWVRGRAATLWFRGSQFQRAGQYIQSTQPGIINFCVHGTTLLNARKKRPGCKAGP